MCFRYYSAVNKPSAAAFSKKLQVLVKKEETEENEGSRKAHIGFPIKV